MINTSFLRRRAAIGLCCLLALAAAPACKRRKVRSAATDEETPRMASVLNLGDTRVEPQLVSGFYGVEAGAWRWAGKQFTVSLRPPAGAAAKGAKLTVKLTVPQVVIDKNKNVTLSATVGNAALAPETYTTPGDYFYVRDVPASALAGDSVRVDFALDKVMPPSGADIRELGIIVFSIGLESK
jgi:hypothetical protein